MRRRILNVKNYISELLLSLRFEFNDDHTRSVISHLISTTYPFILPDNIIFSETPSGTILEIFFSNDDDGNQVVALSFNLHTLESNIGYGEIERTNILYSFKYFR